MSRPAPIATRRSRAKPARRSGRPPASDGEVTRRRILDAALTCFATHGYRETSNRIVADAAGVTTGTLYHYFRNKRDMFLSVHAAIQDELADRIRQPTQAAPTFRDGLKTYVEQSLALYKAHPDYSRFNAVVRTEALRNPEIEGARLDQEWRRFFHRLTDVGMATGEIDAADARTVRHVLSMVTLGLTQHGIEASAADHAECLRGVLRLFDGKLVRRAKP